MTMIYMFIFTFIGTLLATFLGSLFPNIIKDEKKKISSFLSSFSLGIILSLVFLELIPHSLEHSEHLFENSVYGILISLAVIFGSGLIFFFLHELIHRLTDHHHHDEKDEEGCHDHLHLEDIESNDRKTLFYSAVIFLFSILIHNIPEGFVLGTVFDVEENVVPLSGITMSISLFFHNLIIGYSISKSFRTSGRSKTFSILVTSVNGLVSFLLAILGFFISSPFHNDWLTTIIFSFSSGSLLYVLLIELIPQSFKEYKNKYTFVFIILGFVIGAFLVLI